MSLLEAIIMGIIQGVTEFLPISSSGHLSIGKEILGLSEVPILFDIMLHVGTLIAVLIAYWVDIKELIIEGFSMIRDLFKNLFVAMSLYLPIKCNESEYKYIKIVTTPYRRFVILVLVSTIPTGIVGIVVSKILDSTGNALIIPGLGLLITGIILLIADNTQAGHRVEMTTSYFNAIMIGLAQGFATIPGISRSGATITACLLCGFDKTYAVKYSFIISIPAILAAALLDMFKFADTIYGYLVINYLVGTVVAGVVGYICVKIMLKIVRDKQFYSYTVYCFIIGVIAITYYLLC